jgi:hypothetical protein
MFYERVSENYLRCSFFLLDHDEFFGLLVEHYAQDSVQ